MKGERASALRCTNAQTDLARYGCCLQRCCSGDTATDYDPTGHLLCVMEGNSDGGTPTQAQLDQLALLVAWGSHMYDVPIHDALGHRDHAATTWTGDALHAEVHNGTLEEAAAAIVEAGGVTLSLGG